jgi:hypothetical protein
MRHLTDTLVWFGLITLLAAVVYFTPRLADFVSTLGVDHGQGSASRPETVFHHHAGASDLAP